MSIFKHILENKGELPKPPKKLSRKKKAEWFSRQYDDLSDGAFFALAEEMGINIEDFGE